MHRKGDDSGLVQARETSTHGGGNDMLQSKIDPTHRYAKDHGN